MAGGRPKKEIDKRIFEELCAIHCTQAEICNILDVTDKTLTNWCKDTYELSFSEAFKQKSAKGKASLRKAQFEMAKKNATMGIWLGKQYLDQHDKQQIEHDVSKITIVNDMPRGE